jgi:hypothetical protein
MRVSWRIGMLMVLETVSGVAPGERHRQERKTEGSRRAPPKGTALCGLGPL